MGQEFDREFDALLRRTAARRGAPVAQTAKAGPHLDADERAAFAENALPAAARTAYVAHLADCAECRRAVAGLAAGAGMAARLDQSEAAKVPATEPARAARGAGWRARLSALFAPRTLSFVAPALAICLAGVFYLALRSGRTGGENLSARRAAETNATAPGGALMNANTAPNADPSNASREQAEDGIAAAEMNAAAAAPGQSVETKADSETKRRADAGAARGDNAAPPSEIALASPVERTQAGVGSGVGAGAGGSAPAPPPAATESRAESKAEDSAAARENVYAIEPSELERSNRMNQIRGIENQQTPDGSRNRSNSARGGGGGNLPPPPAPRETAVRKPPRLVANSPERDRQAAAAASDEAEVRAIEGRRFRRAGGVWVDANYKDSLPTTGVRRGTAAYRALVAERPEVGRVAERLGGEVVVVAGGRAYRIKP